MAGNQSTFLIIAGRLCLDFVNTEAANDLTTYQHLVVWARQAGALDPAEADYVLERWTEGEECTAALQTALHLRAQLRHLADRLVVGERTGQAPAIEAVNTLLKSRPGYLQLEGSSGEWSARWKVPLRRADDVLWRVARSAADLLANDDLRLVRRCARPRCGLFFYDGTKNGRKRYCRMEVCGSAERAAAYYRRRKAGG